MILRIPPDPADRNPVFKALRSFGFEPEEVSTLGGTDHSFEIFQFDEEGNRIAGLDGTFWKETVFLSPEESERWKFALRRVGAL